MDKKKLLRCPICEFRIPWDQLRGYMPVKCPSCKQWVCVPRTYKSRALLVSHLLTILETAILLMLTRNGLFVFAYIPVFFVTAPVVGFLTGSFFPPAIVACNPEPGFGRPLGLS
jgi:hypothetical protein